MGASGPLTRSRGGRLLAAAAIGLALLSMAGADMAQSAPGEIAADIDVATIPNDVRAATPEESARSWVVIEIAEGLPNKPRSTDPAARVAAWRELVAIHEATSGPNHPQTARNLRSLALELEVGQQRAAEAEPYYRRALAIMMDRLGPNHSETLLTAQTLAFNLIAQGRWKDSVPIHRARVAGLEARFGPNHPDVISALGYLESALYISGDNIAAEPIARRVLAARDAEQPVNPALVGSAAKSLGYALSGQGRATEAEPLYRRAVAAFEAAGPDSRTELLNSLLALAGALQNQYKYDEAERYFRRATEVAVATNTVNSQNGVLAYGGLGSVLVSQNRYAEADPLLGKAYEIAAANFPADDIMVGDALHYKASNWVDLDRAAEAEPLLRQALAIRQAKLAPSDGRISGSYQILAYSLRKQAKYAEAIALGRRALALDEARTPRDESSVGFSLNWLGRTLIDAGRSAEAEPLLSRGLSILERRWGANSPEICDVLGNLAEALSNVGRNAEAETLQRRSWAIREATLGAAHPSVANDMIAVARTMLNQRRYEESAALASRALAIYDARLGADSSRSAGAAMVIATSYNLLDRRDEARPFTQRMLANTEKHFGSEHPEFAGALVFAALQAGADANDDQVVPMLSRALAISERTLPADHPALGTMRVFLAMAYSGRNLPAQAEPLLRRAYETELRTNGAEGPMLGTISETFAATLLQLHRDDEALDMARRGLRLRRLNVSAPSDTASAANRKTFANTGAYILTRAAWQRAQANPGEAAALRAEAFDSAQSIRSSASSDALAQGAARVAAERVGAGAIVRTWNDARLRVAAIDGEVAQAAAEGAGSDAQRNALLAERAATVTAIQRSEGEIAARFPRYFDLLKSPTLPLSALQATQGPDARLLRPEEALVLITPGVPGATEGLRRGFVFVVTKETSAWAELPLEPNALRDEVAALHGALASPISTDAPGVAVSPSNIRYDRGRAFALYGALFGAPQIAAVLATKTRWLLAPQGALMSLPFNALVIAPPPGGPAGDSNPVSLRATQWLGLTKTLAVIPSVSSLRVQRQIATMTQSAQRTPFFGLGDPAFDGIGGGAEKGADRAARDGTRAARTYFRGGVADGAALASLPRLRSTGPEIQALAASFGVGPESYLLQRNATEAELRLRNQDGRLGRAEIVAFATHGIMAGEMQQDIVEPALALAPPRAPDGRAFQPDNDGLLTASEAATLTLSARWVILSACNTASGGAPDAESLTGLARAFLYAGAQSLLVSHYPVLDSAAMKLTTRAAGAARDGATGRPEAMRASMQALINDTSQDRGGASFAHPTAWAPFAVIDPN